MSIARPACFLVILAALVSISGCISTIAWISAPASVNIDEEFVIAIDGVVAGETSGMAGVVIQIPSTFEYLGGSYISSIGRRPLRRSGYVETRYREEEFHSIIAACDSLPFTSLDSDTLRVFLRFKASEAGTFTLKFVAGGAVQTGTQYGWRSTDPKNILDFSQVTDTHNCATLTVVEPERNGTAAISFAGTREYLTVPDSGLFAFTMRQDFSIEMWMATTARDVALVSTRTDDFLSPFPFELGIDERGCLKLASSDGRRLYETSSTVFLADGVWHHIAMTYEASSHVFELYRDGLFLSQATASSEIVDQTHEPVIIAARASKRKFYFGIMDELRFWSVRRSPEEIVFYKNIALTGYEENLVACFTFDKGQGGKILSMAMTEGFDATAYNRPKLVPSLAPLRIELLSFNVVTTGSTVDMLWETFDESKVRSYQVEKRDASGKFTTFQKVEPQRRAENHQSYHLTDTWSEKTVIYYRLRKTNTDGSTLFSDEIPVGMEEVMNFALGENEPNPFSTITEIPFILSESTYVSLEVYDLMGRLVEELLSDKKAAGSYREKFDGSGLPPGLYFYKMRTPAGSQTKKMYLSRQ